ncbi:MAG: hypothetical protein RSB41_02435 [Bacilli bacterium]
MLDKIFERIDFFLVFVFLIMIILFIVLVFLVRLQIKENKAQRLEKLAKDELIKSEESKLMTSKNENTITQEKLDLDNVSSLEVTGDITQNTLSTESKEIETNLSSLEQEIYNDKEDKKDEISVTHDYTEYEKNQEEEAITSIEELKKNLEQRKKEDPLFSNEKLIEQYEQEQESSAIISYEELLENASKIKLNYKPQNIEGINVQKIELEPTVSNIVSNQFNSKEDKEFNFEEEFLKRVKDFRTSLQ